MVFLTSARWSHRAKAVGAGEETIVLALGGSPGKEDEGGRQMWAAEPDVENDWWKGAFWSANTAREVLPPCPLWLTSGDLLFPDMIGQRGR